MGESTPLAYDEITFLDERLEVLLGPPRRLSLPRPRQIRTRLAQRLARPGARRN